MSFKPEVCTSNGITWSGNALRFATLQEAEAYVLDLACRWTAVTDTRVVPSEDPVNYTWTVENGAQRIALPGYQDERFEVKAGPWS